MTRASPLEPWLRLIERFIRTQHFRHPLTPKCYAGTLRNFSTILTYHGGGGRLTVSLLQQSLKEHSLKWQAHILFHRTFLVERYLN